jgi:hypothetical protein
MWLWLGPRLSKNVGSNWRRGVEVEVEVIELWWGALGYQTCLPLS